MVVAVEYISKEESADAETATHGVTGILAVQGAFAEHAAVLDKLGAPWKLLRAAEDFDESIDRVILPGGESTTQGKLLRSTGLFEPIAAHIKAGKPVLGTCAGMILLAKKLDNDENVYFGALDAVVRRNAYGRQLGSFQAIADFGQADDPQRIADFPLVFIRGPYVVSVGPEATVETRSRWSRGGPAPRQHPRHRLPSRTHGRRPHPRALPVAVADSSAVRLVFDRRIKETICHAVHAEPAQHGADVPAAGC